MFIEYESPEIAQVAVETIKEYPGITEPLLVMNKQEYIDMKSKEKFGNAAWDTEFSEVKNFIEYYNAEQLNFKEIKELVAAVTPIGRLEEVGGRGSGVIQLNEITPEEFLEKLVDNKIQDVCFRLASDDARREFIKIQKNFRQQRQQSKRGGRGGRGGRGRGGRGGRGNGRGGGFRGEKRANDNPSSEFDPKRPRPVRGSGIEVKASTPKKEN